MCAASIDNLPPRPSSDTTVRVQFGFENSYAQLPEHFYRRVAPVRVGAPRLLKLNVELAAWLRLDPEALASEEGVQILAGNVVAEGAEPMALAYAGHQFGHFVPQLGDGRAHLLGEVRGDDGRLYDLQLKGSGPTPFSRRGDGRAALGPVLREYLVSEAMAAMGVPTTRALAAVVTGERVYREMPLPGAVLTRVAASHLRVGTFQYFAALSDTEALRQLADYAIARHYPEVAQAERPYRGFLEGVIERHAELVARWMLLGFVHGVMNTDNTSISGETLDYGPCAFMEAFDPATVFSSIDSNGRYAYGNQPYAAQWNLTRLAEAILPLLEAETGSEERAIAVATECLEAFLPRLEAARLQGFRRKLGIAGGQEDAGLVKDLLERMTANRVDFTLFFRRLCASAERPGADMAVRELFADPSAFEAWATRWRALLARQQQSGEEVAASMRRVNPAFIPRNHLVEEALQAATLREDFSPFEALLEVILRPFEGRPDRERYATPARPEETVRQTFCGT